MESMTLAIVMSAASAVTGAIGRFQQGRQQRDLARYQAALARNNQTVAGYHADDALKRGETEEKQHRLRVEQLKGRQRSVQGGRGLLTDTGSNLHIVLDTAEQGEFDALTIRSNAARQAWAHRNEAANFGAEAGLLDAQARNAYADGLFGGVTSLLSGAGTVAEKWYQAKKADPDWQFGV